MGPVLKVRAGDVLHLENVTFSEADPQKPQDGGAAPGVKVAAVTDKRPMGVTMLSFGNVVMVTSEAGFRRLAASIGLPADYISRRTLLITPDDQRVESALNEMFGITRNVGVYNASSGARYQRSMGTLMRVFVYGFITLISLICIANIFNTVSTNVALRRKEFAMLRSVGMTPKGFNRMIRFESIFYGLSSLLWGLPLSVAVAYIIYRLQNPVVRTAFSLPWGSYAFAVGAIFLVVFATMLYSSHRFKRENIIEALREENL
jgi:putative ABC transport system permease protein